MLISIDMLKIFLGKGGVNMFDDDLDIDNGVYAVPSNYKSKFGLCWSIANRKNVNMEELTEEEVKQFL